MGIYINKPLTIRNTGYALEEFYHKGFYTQVHIFKVDPTTHQLNIVLDKSKLAQPNEYINIETNGHFNDSNIKIRESDIFMPVARDKEPVIKGGINVAPALYNDNLFTNNVGQGQRWFYSTKNDKGAFYTNLYPQNTPLPQTIDNYKRDLTFINVNTLPMFCIFPSGQCFIEWVQPEYLNNFIKNTDTIIGGSNVLVYEGYSIFDVEMWDSKGVSLFNSTTNDSKQRFSIPRDGLEAYDKAKGLTPTYRPKSMIGYRQNENDILLVLVENGCVTTELCTQIMLDLGCEYAMSLGSGGIENSTVEHKAIVYDAPSHKKPFNYLFATGKYKDGIINPPNSIYNRHGKNDGIMSNHFTGAFTYKLPMIAVTDKIRKY